MTSPRQRSPGGGNEKRREKSPEGADHDSFRVYIRCRPLLGKEKASPQSGPNSKPKRQDIVKLQDNVVFVLDPDGHYGRRDRSYAFDRTFGGDTDNQTLYQRSIKDIVLKSLDGYNCTVFAYGMTGAGKTHTMLGNIYEPDETKWEKGLCFLAVEDLFSKIEVMRENNNFKIKLSYMEIYNEQVKDLLVKDSPSLMIVEDPSRGIVVTNLTEFPISTLPEVRKLIMTGNERRTMAPTGANQFSSRSHAIIMLHIEHKDKARNIVESVNMSKLSLIDLAGSERGAASDNRGKRLMEGANINRSLLALGNCINILSDSKKGGQFVPYRDSKLTRLLKDSLGGNTRTSMVACVSPAAVCYEETINTLKYASRARDIKKKITKNVKEVEVHVSRYKEIITSLKSEIEVLRGQLKRQTGDDPAPLMDSFGEVETLSMSNERHQLSEFERQKDELRDEIAKDQLMIDDNVSEVSQTEAEPTQLRGEAAAEIVEELSHKMMLNFEENWELTQSLDELKELRQKNEVSLRTLNSELESHQRDGDRQDPATLSTMQRLKEGIEDVRNIMTMNEQTKLDLEQRLDNNLIMKNTMQKKLMRLHQSKRKNLLEMQIQVRMLKLEKLELHTENVQFKRSAALANKQSQDKDRKIVSMEKEILELRALVQQQQEELQTKRRKQRSPTSSKNYITQPKMNSRGDIVASFWSASSVQNLNTKMPSPRKPDSKSAREKESPMKEFRARLLEKDCNSFLLESQTTSHTPADRDGLFSQIAQNYPRTVVNRMKPGNQRKDEKKFFSNNDRSDIDLPFAPSPSKGRKVAGKRDGVGSQKSSPRKHNKSYTVSGSYKAAKTTRSPGKNLSQTFSKNCNKTCVEESMIHSNTSRNTSRYGVETASSNFPGAIKYTVNTKLRKSQSSMLSSQENSVSTYASGRTAVPVISTSLRQMLGSNNQTEVKRVAVSVVNLNSEFGSNMTSLTAEEAKSEKLQDVTRKSTQIDDLAFNIDDCNIGDEDDDSDLVNISNEMSPKKYLAEDADAPLVREFNLDTSVRGENSVKGKDSLSMRNDELLDEDLINQITQTNRQSLSMIDSNSRSQANLSTNTVRKSIKSRYQTEIPNSTTNTAKGYAELNRRQKPRGSSNLNDRSSANTSHLVHTADESLSSRCKSSEGRRPTTTTTYTKLAANHHHHNTTTSRSSNNANNTSHLSTASRRSSIEMKGSKSTKSIGVSRTSRQFSYEFHHNSRYSGRNQGYGAENSSREMTLDLENSRNYQCFDQQQQLQDGWESSFSSVCGGGGGGNQSGGNGDQAHRESFQSGNGSNFGSKTSEAVKNLIMKQRENLKGELQKLRRQSITREGGASYGNTTEMVAGSSSMADLSTFSEIPVDGQNRSMKTKGDSRASSISMVHDGNYQINHGGAAGEQQTGTKRPNCESYVSTISDSETQLRAYGKIAEYTITNPTGVIMNSNQRRLFEAAMGVNTLDGGMAHDENGQFESNRTTVKDRHRRDIEPCDNTAVVQDSSDILGDKTNFCSTTLPSFHVNLSGHR